MKSFSNYIKAGMGALALASSSFNATAAGLIDDDAAVNRYGFALSTTLAAATGDDAARGTVGGLVVDLETALQNPADKARIVVYPQQTTVSMLQLAAVVPPRGLETENIYVCAEKDSKVLTTLAVTPKGEVLKAAWNGNTTSTLRPNGTAKPACNDFIVTARKQLNDKAAELAQPVAQPAATSRPAVTTTPLSFTNR